MTPVRRKAQNGCSMTGEPQMVCAIKRGLVAWATAGSLLMTAASAFAAQGEMGTGVPRFGIYSPGAGGQLSIVWQLEDASLGFPSGCTNLVLSAGTMGLDTYKMAIATMTVARATTRRVRFFAHAPRDGGCGVDCVEML